MLSVSMDTFSFAADSILQLPPEFKQGDSVKKGVLENGVRKSKKMEVVRREVRNGRWKYQIKPSSSEGATEDAQEAAVHRDENGDDWFTEDQLELY